MTTNRYQSPEDTTTDRDASKPHVVLLVVVIGAVWVVSALAGMYVATMAVGLIEEPVYPGTMSALEKVKLVGAAAAVVFGTAGTWIALSLYGTDRPNRSK